MSPGLIIFDCFYIEINVYNIVRIDRYAPFPISESFIIMSDTGSFTSSNSDKSLFILSTLNVPILIVWLIILVILTLRLATKYSRTRHVSTAASRLYPSRANNDSSQALTIASILVSSFLLS